MDINSCNIGGRLTKDPEAFGEKKNVVKFSIATNYGPRDDQKVEYTDVVCFKYTADAAMANLKKGDAVLVYGRKQTNSWEDRDGNPRKSVEIAAMAVYKQCFAPRSDDRDDRGRDRDYGRRDDRGRGGYDDRY